MEGLRGGESIQQFADRIKTALEQIREKHFGKTILLVSHGGCIRYDVQNRQQSASRC